MIQIDIKGSPMTSRGRELRPRLSSVIQIAIKLTRLTSGGGQIPSLILTKLNNVLGETVLGLEDHPTCELLLICLDLKIIRLVMLLLICVADSEVCNRSPRGERPPLGLSLPLR